VKGKEKKKKGVERKRKVFVNRFNKMGVDKIILR